MSPCLLDGALLRISHPVFDFGEGLFDRVVMMTLQSGFLLRRGIG